MKATTIQKNIVTSTRKLQLVADMIRTMSPEQALVTLQFTQKAATIPLSKAIKTVMANAKNNGLDLNNLNFEKIEINEGPSYKRARAASRSFVSPYKKRTSHIKIVLTDVPQIKKDKKMRSKAKVVEEVKDIQPKKQTKKSKVGGTK